jgi:hypothetical protein
MYDVFLLACISYLLLSLLDFSDEIEWSRVSVCKKRNIKVSVSVISWNQYSHHKHQKISEIVMPLFVPTYETLVIEVTLENTKA